MHPGGLKGPQSCIRPSHRQYPSEQVEMSERTRSKEDLEHQRTVLLEQAEIEPNNADWYRAQAAEIEKELAAWSQN